MSRRARFVVLLVVAAACHHDDHAAGDAATANDGAIASDGGGDSGVQTGGPFCVEGGWCWQRPNQFGTSLAAVWGNAVDDVWAAGADGTLAHFDGASWQLVPSGSSADLYAVWGASAHDVWAVGDGGTVLHFDGTSWSTATSPTTEPLNAIAGTSATDIYAVGGEDTKLHWDGTVWTSLPSQVPDVKPTQYGVWASPSGEAWSAGIPYNDVVEHRTGGAWTTTPVASIGSLSFKSVWGSSDQDVWIVGDPAVEGFLQRWNGQSWQSVYPPSDSMLAAPLVVTGSGPNDVWFFGGWQGSGHWNGTAFVAQPELTYEYLSAGWVDASGAGWTVGAGGRMARKSTIGGAWTFTGGSPSGPYDTLARIFVLGDSDAWAVGRLSLSHWDGAAWTDVAPATTTYRQEFTGAWGASANDVWAVSWGSNSPDNLQHWDGHAWSTTAHPGPSYLNAIWGNAANDIWVSYAGGNGGMHYDGAHWQTTIVGPGGDSTAMHGTTSGDIWCVGLAGMIKHYDGTAWTTKASGTTADLYAIEAFSAGDAWAAGGTTVLHWNGTAWQTALAPATTSSITSLAGTSSTDLWAATSVGEVFHFDGAAWTRMARLSVGVFALARAPGGAMFAAGGNGSILRRGP
jgi:hypothetical protein